MKKLLILILLSVGAFGQDTLSTKNGKYLLNESVWSKDSSFVFSPNVTKVSFAQVSDTVTFDNCKVVRVKL